MPTLLRLRPDGPQWPYSIVQLRVDEPQLSISAAPHAGEIASWLELKPPIAIIEPEPTDPPEHDPAAFQAREVTPVEVDGVWHQAWQLIELPPPPEPEPQPDFRRLRGAIRSENGYVDAFMAAMQADPITANSLISRLDVFELTGNFTMFLESLQLALQILPVQDAAHVGLEFMALAQRCHMPVDFLNALQTLFPEPAP